MIDELLHWHEHTNYGGCGTRYEQRLLVKQFYRGVTKMNCVHEKIYIGLCKAEPHTTFFSWTKIIVSCRAVTYSLTN